MKEQIELLSEHKKYYTAKIKGKPVKLFKINIEEMKLKHIDDLLNASKYISKTTLNESIKVTRGILKNIPKINEYEKISKFVVTLMNMIYYDLKPHKLSHLMHTLVKNTDPNIYGKAQTFIRQIEMFNEDLEKIKQFVDK